jgi:hypothetical protein
MTSAVEDRDQILQLLYRYNHAFDSGDGDGWADLFTPDGVLQSPAGAIAGRAELAEHAKSIGGERHVVVNPVITLDGDTASVRAYLLLFRGVELSVLGRYEDDLARTSEGWRFVRRNFLVDGLSPAYHEAMEAHIAAAAEASAG